jgi:predicted MFS family arabinose efflux permease
MFRKPRTNCDANQIRHAAKVLVGSFGEGKLSTYRWIVLFSCFLAFVAYAFVFQSMPPLLSQAAMEFNISEAQAGLLMSSAVVPGIILALPTGLIVNKYGFRRLGFVSILLIAAGSLITALADNFSTALLGRSVLGVGGAFIVVGTPALISQWFDRKELGKAMGLYATNMPVATILAFPVATVLAQSYNDWHYPFYVGTLLAAAVAFAFVFAVREGPLGDHTESTGAPEIRHALGNSEVWKASLVWMFFNGAAIAYLSWAKTLFESHKGLPSFEASVFASVLMYAAVFFVPIFGWASDKTDKRKLFLVGGSIAMAAALMTTSVASGVTLLACVIMLGITAAIVPPVVMTIPSQNLPPNLSGTAFSMVTLCQNVGIAFAAPYAGYLIQTTGEIVATFFGISLLSLAAAAVALTMKTR